jgi:hypothetical protein
MIWYIYNILIILQAFFKNMISRLMYMIYQKYNELYFMIQ